MSYTKNELLNYWDKNGFECLEDIKDLQGMTFVPFVGAGMSVPFGYRTWNEFLKKVTASLTEKKKRTEVYNTLRKGEYLEAAELLNNFTNNALMGDVEREFKESRMTAPGHNYISLLKNNGVKRYITTNYDSVIEKNYAANGDKLEVVIPAKTTKNTFRSYNRKETPYVIKLHGTYDDPESIVLTKSQYDKQYKETVPFFIRNLWKNNVFLFIGCGLQKDYLIDELFSLAEKSLYNWNYAIVEYPRNKRKIKEKEEYLHNLKIHHIWYPAGAHECVYLILSMLYDKGTSEKTNRSQIDLSTSFEKYVDGIAKKAQKNQNIIYQAIMMQREPKKTEDVLSIDRIVDKIYESIPQNKCAFRIMGEPGTGKSTIFSLAYQEMCSREKNLKSEKNIYPVLIDLNFYEGYQDRREELSLDLEQIEKILNTNVNVCLFIDGLNGYVRTTTKYENMVYSKIKEWGNRKNLFFCYSIGNMENKQFPPFSRNESIYSLPGANDENTLKIDLKPVETSHKASKRYRDMVTGVLEFYQMKPVTPAEINTIKRLCIEASGNHVEFRTVNVIVKSYTRLNASKDVSIGRLLERYYIASHNIDKRQLFAVSDFVANFMLNKKKTDDSQYGYLVYKCDMVRDFFFAYYYINSFKYGCRENLSIFNCLFTPCINRFSLDLMNDNENDELTVVNNMISLFDELSLKQKNQVIYLLGRVKHHESKNRAISFLKKVYKEEGKHLYSNAYDANAVMLFRTAGVSLIYLKSYEHENEFYHILIYDKNVRELNRNFHIIYYSTKGYKVSDRIELSSKENREVDIVSLYGILSHSILKGKDAHIKNLNVITMVNLVIYGIYISKSSNRKLKKEKCKKFFDKLQAEKFELNEIVKDFLNGVCRYIDYKNVYSSLFSEIYELSKSNRPEDISESVYANTVVEHTWVCCMIAQFILTNRIKDCDFMSKEEVNQYSEGYSKLRIIQLLLIHSFSGGSVEDKTTPQKIPYNERDILQTMQALDAFPHFHSFSDTYALCTDLVHPKDFNSKVAYDIQKIEPVLRACINREMTFQSFDKKRKDEGRVNFKDELITDFGKNFWAFLKEYLFYDFQ